MTNIEKLCNQINASGYAKEIMAVLSSIAAQNNPKEILSSISAQTVPCSDLPGLIPNTVLDQKNGDLTAETLTLDLEALF